MRRRPPLRAILLLLLAALPCAARPPDAGREGPRLSAVSFNLYHDKADWPRRLPLIVAELRALKPDVIALQEVLQHRRLPNQARTIADALGYEMHFVSTDPPGRQRRYGNAILTPHPILSRSWRPLQPSDDARTVAHLRIAVAGQALDVYATHLHASRDGDAIRRRQAQELLEYVRSTGSAAPRILLGDFNATIDSAALRPLLADYTDSYGSRHPDADAGPASSTLNPAFFEPDRRRRIDHILIQRGRFEVLDADIVLDQPDAAGRWPSDHFGMHAVLRLTTSVRGGGGADARGAMKKQPGRLGSARVAARLSKANAPAAAAPPSPAIETTPLL